MAKVNETTHGLRVIQMSNTCKTEAQQTLLSFFFFPVFPASLLPFQAGEKLGSRFDAVKHMNTDSVFVKGVYILNLIGKRLSSSTIPLAY